MIQVAEKDVHALQEFGARLAELADELAELPDTATEVRELSQASTRCYALAHADHIYAALAKVEDGHTPTAMDLEMLCWGRDFAAPLQVDRERMRAAIWAGRERLASVRRGGRA